MANWEPDGLIQKSVSLVTEVIHLPRGPILMETQISYFREWVWSDDVWIIFWLWPSAISTSSPAHVQTIEELAELMRMECALAGCPPQMTTDACPNGGNRNSLSP